MFVESQPAPSAQDTRVDKLYDNLNANRPPRIRLGHESNPGTIAIIPMYDDKRLAGGIPTIDSLAAQQYQEEVQLVIANNGLTPSAVRSVVSMATSRGINTSVVEALPRTQDEQSAGHARNKAVESIHDAAQHDLSFRKGGLLFLDDDTVLLPNGLDELEKTTRENTRCVATMAQNVSVQSIGPETQDAFHSATLEDLPARKMPDVIWNDGSIDVASLIAFGSDAVIKTCGVYVDHESLTRLKEPFIRMPNGSAEDVLLTVGLSQFGTIYTNPNAILLDLARETPSQLRKQRMNWGRDHVHLYDDLDKLGKVSDGMTVLEPVGNVWVESMYEGSDTMTGLIINPAQLQHMGKHLAATLNSEGPEAFGADTRIDILFSELSAMYKALQTLMSSTPKATRIRRDLPAPKIPDTNQTRYSEDALLGLLLGNILGNLDIREKSRNMVYGLRQAAAW